MAALSGQKGNVTWSGANYDVNVFNWSINISQDSHDVTAMAATPPTSKTMIPSGMYEWSGSYESYLDGTTLITAPEDPQAQTITLRLVADTITDQELSGAAFVTSVEASATLGGEAQKVTYNFQGTGALTITAAS